MEAIILCKESENALKPITSIYSKAMMKIFSRPCIEYIFDMLQRAEIKKANVFLKNAKEIEDIRNLAKGSIEINQIGGENNPKHGNEALKTTDLRAGAIVICNMNFYDFDIKKALEHHKKLCADITVITKQYDKNYSNFCVCSDESGNVLSFSESSEDSGFSGEISTGIYIFSENAIKILQKREVYDFSVEFFKIMLSENLKMVSFNESGYMCELSDASDYLQCHRDLLGSKAKFAKLGHKNLSGNFSCVSEYDDVEITAPCYIGKNVTIGKGAKICDSVICDNAFIGEGAKVNRSVLLEGAHIGNATECEMSVVCEGAILQTDASVREGAVIGTNAVVGRGAVVEENVRIWPKKHLEDYKTAAFDIRYGNKAIEFDDESCISGETGTEITPVVAAKIGQSLAKCDVSIAVGNSGTKSSTAIEKALISGILSGAANAWALGECTGSELDFAVKLADCDYGVFVESDSYTKISVFSKGGRKLSRFDEKRIESAIKYENYPKMSFDHFGLQIDFSSVKSLYIESLSKKAPKFPITLNASGKRAKEIAKLLNLDSYASKITFQISSDGRKASAFSAQTGFVSYEKLAMICIDAMLKNGKVPVIPNGFPHHVSVLFEKYGVTQKNSDSEECERFFCDGFELAFCVCDCLWQSGSTLEQTVNELPKFAVSQRVVGLRLPFDCVSMRIKAFCDNHKDISVKPMKSGKTLVMRAECEEYETASELCDICQRLLENENGV